jgi:hypothetical protein
MRDLEALPLREASHMVAEGRVALNGRKYCWEPDVMVGWLTPSRAPEPRDVIAAREAARFTVLDPHDPRPTNLSASAGVR